MHPRRLRQNWEAVVLTTLLAGCGGANAPAERGWLHVVVEGLPTCPYGIGYAEPLRFELWNAQQAIASQMVGGMSIGESSLQVSLHVPDAPSGVYEVRIYRCPPLREAPQASVACASPPLVTTFRVRARAAGVQRPQYVTAPYFEATCLTPWP